MKIGFLLPRSTVYPLIGFDFLDGFKVHLQQLQDITAIEFFTENIGFGIDEKITYAATEQLLLKNNVDVVIAFIDERSVEMIAPLFTATGKILCIVNMGANFNFGVAPPSTTLFLDFNVAFNSSITGKKAIGNGYDKAIMATSYYDGGYLQCFAMVNNYLNHGGKMMGNYVSNFKPSEFNLNTLQQQVETAAENTCILALFSGDVAHLFYQQYAAIQQQQDVKVFGSPMMFDHHIQGLLPTDIDITPIQGYTSWLPQLENAANIELKERFTAYANRQASVFAVLGWEAAQVIYQLFSADNNSLTAAQKVKQLMDKSMDTPRGKLYFDAETHHAYSSTYYVEMANQFQISVIEKIENPDEEWSSFKKQQPQTTASGWRNTYLCS
ncbi:MAG: ABC transporter substrate-binding protein [Ferruginibacter sp.]